MKNVKMTKANEQRLISYERSEGRNDLYQVYTSPSDAKVKAYDWIINEMDELGGWDIRITGSNCMTFSCAYKYNGEDGLHLRYHTAYNVYDFKIEED